MSVQNNIDGRKIEVSGKLFTVSNFISFSRIFIVIPVVYRHYINGYSVDAIIILLIGYGIISDYLDGFVARKTNTISEIGKMIDPISDKIAAGLLFIYTVVIGWIPFWFLWLFIARDILILIGSSFIKLRYGKVAMSTISGKISVNVISLYWISIFFFRSASLAHTILLWASVAIMLFSFIMYLLRYRNIMNGARFN
ncbi:MAG: CDP-alcohol phosphatidyltransferase family protein [Bacteroidota bacterium]|nr:CDP-alcohol phosphatidyltransferase family protein [Bacteroidota bacterium]